MLFPDTVEFVCSVFGDLGLDVLDITLVELARFAVFEYHQIGVFFSSEGETGKDFEGRAGDSPFVGTRVLEKNDLAFFEMETSLLRQEEIGTFHDILEVRLAIRVDKSGNIGNIDGFRTSATWNEQICLEPEVRRVSEVSPVQYYFASCEGNCQDKGDQQ